MEVIGQQDTASGAQRQECGARGRALDQVLDRIANKWTILVVGSLSHGPLRFNALRRLIDGVSHRMLTLTLRGLERNGLVRRTVYATVPPQVEYALTPVGHSLIEPLRVLAAWAEENLETIKAAEAAAVPDCATQRAGAGG